MKTLVTKLMSSVNNADIPYFNAVEIVLDRTKYSSVTIKKDTKIHFVLAADKGTITTDGVDTPAQEITVNGGPNKIITFSSEVEKLYIKSNFNSIIGIARFGTLKGIYLNYIPKCQLLQGEYLLASIKELCENMNYLHIVKGGLYGNVSELKSNNYTKFAIYANGEDIVGTLNDLCEHLVDAGVTECGIATTKLTGDFSLFNSKVSLSDPVVLYVNSTVIYGTVESVINYLTGKKKSSTLIIYANNSQVTYNGSSFKTVKFTFDADGNPTLTEKT